METCCKVTSLRDENMAVQAAVNRMFFNVKKRKLCGYEERLSNLAVLSIESKRAKGLDMDLVVDEFDGRHQNRRITLH